MVDNSRIRSATLILVKLYKITIASKIDTRTKIIMVLFNDWATELKREIKEVFCVTASTAPSSIMSRLTFWTNC